MEFAHIEKGDMDDDYHLAQLLQFQEYERAQNQQHRPSVINLGNDLLMKEFNYERNESNSKQLRESEALVLSLYQDQLQCDPVRLSIFRNIPLIVMKGLIDAKAAENELGPTPDARELFMMVLFASRSICSLSF